jgi:hypothetical protein
MPITLNGTTGVVTPGATVGSITGILKATSGVVSQAVAGSDYGQLTLATAQAASGTSVDFTGIPSWVKRITVMLNGVSTNGGSILVQIGSGSIATTGYASCGALTAGAFYYKNATNGFVVNVHSLAYSATCNLSINLINSNSYISSHSGFLAGANDLTIFGGGNVNLSGVIDRLRITTQNGTDTFDAGTINISYE